MPRKKKVSPPETLWALASLPTLPARRYREFPQQWGLYFVQTPWARRVLYVGMTTDTFRSRWRNHHRLRQAIAANAVVTFWHPGSAITETELRSLEAQSIRFWRSPWNNTAKPMKIPFWLCDAIAFCRNLPVVAAIGLGLVLLAKVVLG